MPQGKLKAKAKVPKTVAAKKKAKGRAVTKRASAPASPKKTKAQAQKLKKVITKTVNAAAEEELRAVALDGKKSLLSKAKASPKAASKAKKTKKKK